MSARTARIGSLTIEYDSSVLEPRAWTARQSEWAAELLAVAPPGPVLELCSGAGHIGLLAILHAPTRRLVMVDASPSANAFAHRNAINAGLSDRVELREGYMDAEGIVDPGERFAVIIADPPYVASGEIGRFPSDPTLAIDGGADGMDVAFLCLEMIDRHLADGGHAVVQLGTAQQIDLVQQRIGDPGRRLRLRVVEERAYPGPSGGVLVRIDRSGLPI